VTTKAAFFARIREEMARTPGLFAATTAPRPPAPGRLAETIRRELSERWPETLERFRGEFERVGGDFHRVASMADVPRVVGDIARARDGHRVATWHPTALGIDLTDGLRAERLEPLPMPSGAVTDAGAHATLRAQIAAADVGLTGVDLAVAETGSLVLVSGAGRPRSTALLPPYHVAVFDREALIESLEQLGVFFEAWHEGPAPAERGAAIHVITGPSRTADIELTLTRGVHGPKEVHAIFVDTPIRG